MPSSSPPDDQPFRGFFDHFYPLSADSNEQRLQHLDRFISHCSGLERSRLLLLIADEREDSAARSTKLAELRPPGSLEQELLCFSKPPLNHNSSSGRTLAAKPTSPIPFQMTIVPSGVVSPSSKVTAVVRPVFGTRLFDPGDNFGRALLGPLFRPSIPLCCFVLAIWFVGFVLGQSALWHFIPAHYIWMVFLCFQLLFTSSCA